MMILLASTANIRAGEIPLTFIAVAIIYLGGEIVAEVKGGDNVSHFGHLVGGSVGAVFGFLSAKVGKGAKPKTVAISDGGLGKLAAPKPAAPVPKPAPKKSA
jgi:membrane associated rhomboid family serine protease